MQILLRLCTDPINYNEAYPISIKDLICHFHFLRVDENFSN